MSVNIAFYNNKGGVSKTISAANVAAGFAQKGYKVLLVDLDPQGNLSQHFGFDDLEGKDSLYDVLYENSTVFSLIKTILPNLHIIPSNSDLYGLDFKLHDNNSHTSIKHAIGFYLGQSYDFIIFDCPAFMSMLSINALVASDYLMIPANADVFSLNGIDILLELIDEVKKKVATRLKIMGVFLTQVDEDSNISRAAQQLLAQHLPELYLKHDIRRDSAIALAPVKGLDIFRFRPYSAGAKDYSRLVEIMLAKLTNKHQLAFA